MESYQRRIAECRDGKTKRFLAIISQTGCSQVVLILLLPILLQKYRLILSSFLVLNYFFLFWGWFFLGKLLPLTIPFLWVCILLLYFVLFNPFSFFFFFNCFSLDFISYLVFLYFYFCFFYFLPEFVFFLTILAILFYTFLLFSFDMFFPSTFVYISHFLLCGNSYKKERSRTCEVTDIIIR